MKHKKVTMEQQTRNIIMGQPEIQDDEKRKTEFALYKKEMRVSQDGNILGKLKTKQVDMSLSSYYTWILQCQ